MLLNRLCTISMGFTNFLSTMCIHVFRDWLVNNSLVIVLILCEQYTHVVFLHNVMTPWWQITNRVLKCSADVFIQFNLMAVSFPQKCDSPWLMVVRSCAETAVVALLASIRSITVFCKSDVRDSDYYSLYMYNVCIKEKREGERERDECSGEWKDHESQVCVLTN